MIKLVAAKVRFRFVLSLLPVFKSHLSALFAYTFSLSLSLTDARNNDSLSFIVIINTYAEKASGRGGEARRGGRVEREGRPAEKRRGDSVSQR